MLTEVTMKYTNWDAVPVVLSVEQVSRLLDVHINTVRTMIRDGRLSAVKIGKEWRISKDTVKRLLEQDD